MTQSTKCRIMKSMNTSNTKPHCMVHTWNYYDVPEMNMRFRICKKCDCLEGRMELKNLNQKSGWRKYAPTGGIGFLNAIKEKIAKEAAEKAVTTEIPLTTEEV